MIHMNSVKCLNNLYKIGFLVDNFCNISGLTLNISVPGRTGRYALLTTKSGTRLNCC